MDAYDHVAQATIRSSALPLDTQTSSGTSTPNPATTTNTAATPATTSIEQGSLSSDFQDVYKSFSTSDWGSRLGGFFGSVKKSSESVISGVRTEAAIASEEALKGLGELRKEIVGISSDVRKRGMSLVNGGDVDKYNEGEKGHSTETLDGATTSKLVEDPTVAPTTDTEGFVARIRAEAEKRYKDIQKVEDTADEILLKFSSNIRNFLREAVTVSAPDDGNPSDEQTGQLLFESKDAEGKRVIHTSRFDAQLHVIHCSLDSFLKDPSSAEYVTWRKDFNVEKHTDDIANSLQKYEELRRDMEKLVPERVDYNAFWTRYYFLRMIIESEEKRRKELLTGTLLITFACEANKSIRCSTQSCARGRLG